MGRIGGRSDVNSFLKRNKIVIALEGYADRYEMISVGIQLGYLSKEDVAYMASKDTTVIQAQNRLANRRRNSR